MNYVVGLGTNLGDRLHQLRAGLRGLSELGQLRAGSTIYETAPIGPPQPDYLNAAVLLVSHLRPEQLLEAVLGIERAQGRLRGPDEVRFGPRTLDLDLLWYSGPPLASAQLELPHPRLWQRAFALGPLYEVLSKGLGEEFKERAQAEAALESLKRGGQELQPYAPEGVWLGLGVDCSGRFGVCPLEPLQTNQ